MNGIVDSPLQVLMLGSIGAYFAWRVYTAWMIRRRLPALIASGAQVVDVRSAAEFAAGHAPGSRNIPLGELAPAAATLDRSGWIVVCCASGARSGQAMHWLRSHGFQKVYNAGSWRNVR